MIERLGREMLAEMRDDQPLSRLRIDALGEDLVVQLLRRHSNLAGTRALVREQARGGLAPWQVRKVTDRMLALLDDNVSLSELAVLVDLSPSYFCTAFRQSTGLPPHRWLQERRIERAKELLNNPRLSLTEIALEVGYSGQGAFGSAFRKVTGSTPTAWRRERLL